MSLEGQRLGHSHLLRLLGSKRLVLVGLAVLMVVVLVSGIIWLKRPHYASVTEFPFQHLRSTLRGLQPDPMVTSGLRNMMEIK